MLTNFVFYILGIAPPGERQNVIPAVMGPKSKIPHLVIIIVSVVGAFLLVLNVFIVSCFIYRKRKKRLEEGKYITDSVTPP